MKLKIYQYVFYFLISIIFCYNVQYINKNLSSARINERNLTNRISVNIKLENLEILKLNEIKWKINDKY